LPVHILRHFSIPYLEEGKYFRLFAVVQPIGMSLLLIFAFDPLQTAMMGSMPVWAFVILIGFLLTLLVFFTTATNNRPPPYYPIYIFLGIFMAVIWIYVIANELVSLLSAIGKILDISDAIMGITVLAYGNSIGDLVANTVVAKKGIPQMGLGAAFAAPFCNTLLGLGCGLTYYVSVNGPFVLVDSSFLPNSVFFALCGLMISLGFSLIGIPLRKFTYTKPMCVFFAVTYLFVLALQLLTEFSILLPNTNLFWAATFS